MVIWFTAAHHCLCRYLDLASEPLEVVLTILKRLPYYLKSSTRLCETMITRLAEARSQGGSHCPEPSFDKLTRQQPDECGHPVQPLAHVRLGLGI
jgi:hypothetical protein